MAVIKAGWILYLVVFQIRNRSLDKKMFPKVNVVPQSAEGNIWLTAELLSTYLLALKAL